MYLQDLIDDVNKTHGGLGELVAMCQLAVTAHKTLLVISPSGCGKSTSMAYVSHTYDDILKTDS
jgi:ABC-type nitrate/sulfonate/bicarbonate transport system ATPase subunit